MSSSIKADDPKEGAASVITTQRSPADDLRIAFHEAGHLVVSRAFGIPAFATIEPGETFSGLCWNESYERSENHDNDDVTVAAVAGLLHKLMPKDGEPREGASIEYLTVFTKVVIKMAGMAAERLFCADQTAWEAESDHTEALAFASIICSSNESRAAFLEFGLAEASALIWKHRGAVKAIANALVEKRTLNDRSEIDGLIALGLEQERRKAWRQTIAGAAGFQSALR